MPSADKASKLYHVTMPIYDLGDKLSHTVLDAMSSKPGFVMGWVEHNTKPYERDSVHYLTRSNEDNSEHGWEEVVDLRLHPKTTKKPASLLTRLKGKP